MDTADRTPVVAAQGDDDEPLRILLAEDDPVSRAVARLMLTNLGHHVDAVADGVDAVDAVRRGTYDVVLMDLQMPGLDGLAATRQIRTELQAGHRPAIVALTAGGLAEHQAACTAAGMDDHIAKPLRLHTLRAVLATVRVRTAVGAGGEPVPTAAGTPPPAVDAPPDSREAAVRTRLAELSWPGADDGGMLAALLRSFVSRTPQLLDRLEQAVVEHSPGDVEGVAHTLSGAADNIGGSELARQLRDVETRARAGEMPADGLLQQIRREHGIILPVLTGIAGQLDPGPTPLA